MRDKSDEEAAAAYTIEIKSDMSGDYSWGQIQGAFLAGIAHGEKKGFEAAREILDQTCVFAKYETFSDYLAAKADKVGE